MGKQIFRSRRSKVFAGVCGGLAEYFAIDPTIIRVIWAALSLTLFGAGIIIYIIAAIIIPEEGSAKNGWRGSHGGQNYHGGQGGYQRGQGYQGGQSYYGAQGSGGFNKTGAADESAEKGSDSSSAGSGSGIGSDSGSNSGFTSGSGTNTDSGTDWDKESVEFNRDMEDWKKPAKVDSEKSRLVLGAALVIIGVAFLFKQLFSWFDMQYFIPFVLFALGIFIIYKGWRKKQ